MVRYKIFLSTCDSPCCCCGFDGRIVKQRLPVVNLAERVVKGLGWLYPSEQVTRRRTAAWARGFRDSAVRMWAARSLGEIGNPAAANALTRATRDPDPDVAKAARASLQQLRKK